MLKKTVFFLALVMLASHTFATEPPPQSEYALIPRLVFKNPPIWKLTKSVANNYWGKDLYHYPYSSSQDYVMSPTSYLYSGMSFTVDHSWHRILYSECLSNWIRAYGDYGSAPTEFKFPRRVDVEAPQNEDYFSFYYYIFLTDTENDRIIKLRYEWYYTDDIIYDGEIAGAGLFLPLDLDINNGYDFWPVTNDYLWVLNGNSEIKRFTFDGQLKKTYGEFGSGVGQFDHPQAIACGRSALLQPPHDPYANNTHIYVSDNGNNRLVWLIKWTGSEEIAWCKTWDIPTGSNVVDLDVDNFGQVWAVDSKNSRIFKLAYDLNPLCTFGSEGTGSNEFLTPISFANTGGWLGCGNVFVAECWGDQSGGQYFAIGTDILNLESELNPDTLHFNYVHWTLIDPAYSSIKVYDESDVLKRSLFEDSCLYPAGDCNALWDGTDNSQQFVPSGNYRLENEAVSCYISIESEEPVNTVTKDIWICNVHPDDIIGDVDSDGHVGLADVTYLINYLFYGGPPPEPIWKGDVDGGCGIGLSDLVYLIGYLFKGGPAPRWNFECERWWKC